MPHKKKTIRLSETVLPKDEFDQVDPREVLSFKKKDLDGRIFKKITSGKTFFPVEN